MDGSSRRLPAYFDVTGATDADGANRASRLAKVRGLVKPYVPRHRALVVAKHRFIRRRKQATFLAKAVADRARTEWETGYPVVLRHLRERFPSLPLGAASGPDDGTDPVLMILHEFERLDGGQQEKVARNLALLWNSFMSVFDGVSGFQAASAVDQQAYFEKLEAAAHRMEAARGTDAAFHYVTVELIRRYIGFLQIGSTDPKAVALARLVAPLIDRGHKLGAEPFLRAVGS